MLFKPFGVKISDVVDPELLGNEFQEAARVVNETTWWQWANAAFTDAEILADSGSSTPTDVPVAIERNGISVQMKTDKDVEPILVDDVLRTPSYIEPHTNLYQIAYNRGLIDVDDTSVSWTSKYSELLFIAFSFQYVRATLDADEYKSTYTVGIGVPYINELFPGSAIGRIRTQIRIRIDGGDIPGCGPYVVPIDGKDRGTGMGAKSAAPVIVGITVVPAGSHTVSAVAGQKSHALAQSEDAGDASSTFGLEELNVSGETLVAEGVCIGSRRMMVIRFPRGGLIYP